MSKIAWQLDPFGHSATMGRMLAEMGFDAIFFTRIDTSLQDEWERTQHM